METALEHILISTYKASMISYMNAHPEHFEETIELAISNKQPYAWRAAWLLWSCMEDNDKRVRSYIKNIINTLKAKNDNHQRELLKILLQMELNKRHEGILFDHCMNIWEQIDKKPSVRFTAFKFIIKITQKHPDLSHEINLLLQDHYLDSLSPAVKKSISKMMKKLTL